LAFVLVCLGVVVLRLRHPELERPFRTPVYWLVGPLGALACLWVMSGLPHDTWMRLIIWLFIGFVVYFTYGRKHSKLNKPA
jgi:basic amino acid/polyamine antiporter, APA family